MLGFLIVLLSSALFCFQNVIVRILFNPQIIFGVFETGGFVTPTLQNSFLLMFMRMLLGVPLLTLIAPKLHAAFWQDIQKLREAGNHTLLLYSLSGGMLMFLYLALLYISIGLIPTGIALTLFFTYPIFTALFSWRWFGNRPTLFRWIITAFVLLGSFLTIPLVNSASGETSPVGFLAGIASGLTYALYTVVAQKSFEKLHPVPFTWISFTTTLFLSGISLLIWNLETSQLAWLPLWIGGFLSALVTFGGHLLNNLGIRMIGATTASMIGVTNPALTVVLAWLTIQELLSGLQIAGVVIVTFSVALLSMEYKAK
ncbi:MAG: DMT family transporter [Cyanobacteria bacterium RM1_2_2]|nr:DMT family transporter [Cyanobacteria bacterium RM1_2_2]